MSVNCRGIKRKIPHYFKIGLILIGVSLPLFLLAESLTTKIYAIIFFEMPGVACLLFSYYPRFEPKKPIPKLSALLWISLGVILGVISSYPMFLFCN